MGDHQNHRFQHYNGLILDHLRTPMTSETNINIAGAKEGHHICASFAGLGWPQDIT